MTRQNDLRTETDVQYFFGEIKLWREAVPKNSLGIIVEAKSDEKLFRKLVNSKTTFFSVDGWTKAIDTLKLCENNEIVGVLSIIDADFKRILVSTELSENLFFTDFQDKEIMMAHSQAWLEVLNSFGEPQKILKQETENKKSMLNFLLDVIRPIGILRLLNQQYNLDLKFKVLSNNKYKFIDYEDFIDDNTIKIDENNLLKTVENKSQKQGLFKNNLELLKEFEKLNSHDFDLKELGNGHDLLNILAIAFMNFIGNRKSANKVSGEALEESLILAYRLDDFVNTKLFQSLVEWEEKNEPFKVQRI